MLNKIFAAIVVFCLFVGSFEAMAADGNWNAQTYSQPGIMQTGNAFEAVVVTTRNVKLETQSAQPSAMGYVAPAAGAAVGYAIGANVGNGSGRTIAQIAGPLVGMIAGSMIANRASAPEEHVGQEIVLRAQNGQYVTVTQGGSETFAKGQAVLVIQSGGQTRVTAL